MMMMHFLGWIHKCRYDYWAAPDSSDLHPVGYCQSLSPPKPLQKPGGYALAFSWESYLQSVGSVALPAQVLSHPSNQIIKVSK
jgi:hypothetical protein